METTSAAQRQISTPGARADQGPPNHPWQAVVRHSSMRPDMPYRESMYRRSFIARDCIQPDMVQRYKGQEHRARRATIFVTADNSAELKTLMTIFNRRGWDECSSAWKGTLDEFLEGAATCPACFHFLESDGAPCTNQKCSTVVEDLKARAKAEAIAVGQGRAKIIDGEVVWLDKDGKATATEPDAMEPVELFDGILAKRTVRHPEHGRGQLIVVAAEPISALQVMFRAEKPGQPLYPWTPAFAVAFWDLPPDQADQAIQLTMDGVEPPKVAVKTTSTPASLEVDMEDIEDLEDDPEWDEEDELDEDTDGATYTKTSIDLPSGKVLATRFVPKFGHLALMDGKVGLVLQRNTGEGWVVDDATVDRNFREYPDAYLQRIEKGIVEAMAETKAGVVGDNQGTEDAPKMNGGRTEPADLEWTAERVLGLSWSELQGATKGLETEGGGRSRGDLLKALGKKHGITTEELGLE